MEVVLEGDVNAHVVRDLIVSDLAVAVRVRHPH